MIAEIGHFALILALCASLIQGVIPLIGAHKGRSDWIALARPTCQASFVLVGISFAALTWSFYFNDFYVAYVAGHTKNQIPNMYRLSAVWGGHEGSMLLWVLMLVSWAFSVSQLSKTLDSAMVARVLAVLGLITFGLLLFVLFTSNPFDRLFPVPPEGRDLNPLLQDPGLIYHPPMLYMGYVGLS
ncbi:MAG: cytochrome c biogenesis protein CcsA, partial [Burkholderiales bacterium]